VDCHPSESLPEQRAEVRAITGHQGIAFQANGRGEHWSVFFGDFRRKIDGARIGMCSGQVYPPEQRREDWQTFRRLGG
jgi:hypothetical protein